MSLPTPDEIGAAATQSFGNFSVQILGQSIVLLYKNCALALRNPKAVLLQLILPVLLVIAAVGLVEFYSTSDFVSKPVTHPSAETIPSIPICEAGKRHFSWTDPLFLQNGRYLPCYTFIYAPKDNAVVEKLVDDIRTMNEPEIPSSSVKGLAVDEVDQWLYDNGNQTASLCIHKYPVFHSMAK